MDTRTYGTAEIASRTGLSGALLRTWEERYDFPRPARIGSGRRRYSEADLTDLLDVKRRRDAGVRLAAAIAAVRRGPGITGESLYAYAREHWPHASVHQLDKRMLLAVSHAIEDECHAAARSPVLFGLFQSGDSYAAAEARWRELARTSRATVVFADFSGGATPPDVRPTGPQGVALPPSSPLLAEWVVVVDGIDLPMALVARETLHETRRPRQGARFDAVWTLDPGEVRDLARQCVRLASAGGVEVSAATHAALDEPAATAAAVGAPGAAASGLLARVVSYAAAAATP